MYIYIYIYGYRVPPNTQFSKKKSLKSARLEVSTTWTHFKSPTMKDIGPKLAKCRRI